jgi:hypothetical protein
MSQIKFSGIRKGSCIVPVTNYSEKEMLKLQEHKEFTVTVKETRNPKQLDLYWVICTMIAENHPDFRTKDEVDLHFKIEMKQVEFFSVKKGDGWVEYIKPRSIAEESMGKASFTEYLNNCIDYAANELLGVTSEEFRTEFANKFIGNEVR